MWCSINFSGKANIESPHKLFVYYFVSTRETREGWPLLIVENEANRDYKSTNERGPSLVGSLARRAGTRDFYPALAVLVYRTLSIYVSSSPNNLGRQSCRAAWSLNMCHGSYPPTTSQQAEPTTNTPHPLSYFFIPLCIKHVLAHFSEGGGANEDDRKNGWASLFIHPHLLSPPHFFSPLFQISWGCRRLGNRTKGFSVSAIPAKC